MAFPVAMKTALVTGANRGIGTAIVEALFTRGAAKVYAAARDASALAPLVARHGPRVVPLQIDVTKPEEIQRAVASAPDVELLVNNAGVAAHAGGAFTDPEWLAAGRLEMDVNFFGTFAMTQAFAPVLARNGGGAVVNLGSIASLVSFPMFVAYSASKAATHSLTQTTRAMLRSQGTQVFGVYPGPIDTRMAEPITLEKTSPAVAAAAIVAALEAGTEDIFPDAMSRDMGAGYFADPKQLERQVASMMG